MSDKRARRSLRSMLSFVPSDVRYEPYPLIVLRPAMDQALYDELTRTFPTPDLFDVVPKYDYKLSLSEKFASKNYHRFLAQNSAWNRFRSWIKSDDFIAQTAACLKVQHIDLELDRYFDSVAARVVGGIKRGRLPGLYPRLHSRFEFSVLKADGGEVAPHTDTPKKIITLVLSMIREGEWDTRFGGGLQINRATDNAYAFNWSNRIVPWDKVEVVDTIPFLPNQCMIFVKTFNSLHSVRKMTQHGSSALRKTVTIVIEKDD
jgi:hypothetical protein